MIKRFLYILAVIFLAGIMSCAPFLSKPILDAHETSTAVIARVIQKNFNRLKTLQAQGRLSVVSTDQAMDLFATLNLNKPDSIHMRLEATLGLDVAQLFVNRDHYLMYAPFDNMCYKGSSDNFNLSPYIKLQTSVNELVQLVCGLDVFEQDELTITGRDENSIQLKAVRDEQTFEISLDLEKGVITKTDVFDNDGVLVLKKKMARFVKIKNIYLPQHITIFRPVEQESVSFFYTVFKVNKKIPAKNFHIDLPASVFTIEI